MTDLTPKQSQFIDEYLSCFNASEAARRAGYSPKTAQEQSSRLLSNAIIRAAIEARLRESAMSADEVLARLASQARLDGFSALEVYLHVDIDPDTGEQRWRYDFDAAKADGRLQLLIDYARSGRGETTKLLVDTQTAALDKLAKALRLYDKPIETGGEGALAALRAALNPIANVSSEDA